MFTDTVTGSSVTNNLQRRVAGKVGWRRVLENIIASEREDMHALATLRRKTSDPELLRLIAEMQERKSIRIMELTQLFQYKDAGAAEKSMPPDEPLFPLGRG